MTETEAPPALDHLVVMATSLEEGAAWCEATLGVAPQPGGRHALFGTHNLLLNISSARYPRSYLEIIALDPAARPAPDARGRPRTRWFDMDDPALRERVRAQGPRITHWVARVPDLDAAVTALATRGLDRGDVLAASRDTPTGELRWKIAVRPDGQRLFDGLLPTLIEWSGHRHPTDDLPDSGVAMRQSVMTHPRAAQLLDACAAIGLGRASGHTGAVPGSRVRFDTPRGAVTIDTDLRLVR
ncbi:VOC family protein [Ottowia sp.]|uniref:VOC family protein n=1 Tax=Ottowia sp. TaxID=1898956 RepID=UPI0039E544BC